MHTSSLKLHLSDFLTVGLPVGLFGSALTSLPQSTIEQTLAYRKELLETRRGAVPGAAVGAVVGAALGATTRGDAAVVGGLLGAAAGAMAGTLRRDAPGWNFAEPHALAFSGPNAPLLPESSAPTQASFGYGPFDTYRWIFKSEPSGAELRGLSTSTTPQTDVHIINLPPDYASKAEFFAHGYAACPYKDMSRRPVISNGLEVAADVLQAEEAALGPNFQRGANFSGRPTAPWTRGAGCGRG